METSKLDWTLHSLSKLHTFVPDAFDYSANHRDDPHLIFNLMENKESSYAMVLTYAEPGNGPSKCLPKYKKAKLK